MNFGIVKGTRLQIIPIQDICKGVNTWWGTVIHDPIVGMYPLVFDNQICPVGNTPSGLLLQYWLKAESPNWKLYSALQSNPANIFTNSGINIGSIKIQEKDGQFTDITTKINRTTPTPIVTEANVPMPVKTLLNETSLQKRRQDIQEVLLNKYKPRLVRNVEGAKQDGLGIRDPVESEYRKEWKEFKAGEYLSFEIRVTDNDQELLTSLTVNAHVLARYEASPVLNGLGVLYETDPIATVGDTLDIETFAPMYIGRRKLKYWLGIYYDLKDCKVILTPGTIDIKQLNSDLVPGGRGESRLAEYLIGEIKRSTNERVETPYKGDREEKQYLDLLETNKPLLTVAQVQPQVYTPQPVVPITAPTQDAPVTIVEPNNPFETKPSKPKLVPTDASMGLTRLPGGGLDVSQRVKDFRKKQSERFANKTQKQI